MERETSLLTVIYIQVWYNRARVFPKGVWPSKCRKSIGLMSKSQLDHLFECGFRLDKPKTRVSMPGWQDKRRRVHKREHDNRLGAKKRFFVKWWIILRRKLPIWTLFRHCVVCAASSCMFPTTQNENAHRRHVPSKFVMAHTSTRNKCVRTTSRPRRPTPHWVS